MFSEDLDLQPDESLELISSCIRELIPNNLQRNRLFEVTILDMVVDVLKKALAGLRISGKLVPVLIESAP